MLPNNPMILLSWVNTKLRDEYESLAALCEDHELDETALKEKCREITRQIMPYRNDKEICKFITKRQPELKQAVERELQTELGTQRQQTKQRSYER